MKGSSASHQKECQTPALRVSYPLKIGKSVRRGRMGTLTPTSREMMVIKFNHVPQGVSFNQPGMVQRNGESCSIQLPMDDGSSVLLEGVNRAQTFDAITDDYVVVFYNGAFWLEKATDMFCGVRPMDMRRHEESITYPDIAKEDNPEGEPDSWLVPEHGNDIESDSLVTPGVDVVENAHRAPSASPRVGVKSLPSGLQDSNITNFSVYRNSCMVVEEPVAMKPVAEKHLATKRPMCVSNGSVEIRNKNSSSSETDDDSDSESSSESIYTDESSANE